jgi:lipid-A-disaccharide synthase
MRKIKIFLIAGEVSGDKLGASLIKSLRAQFKGKIIFQAVGGDKMAGEGVNSIFPMNQISLMGFVEVLSHVFRILKLIKQTVKAISNFKPDVVVTIDSPGFGTRVAKQIDRSHTKLVY